MELPDVHRVLGGIGNGSGSRLPVRATASGEDESAEKRGAGS
jgi:hypothetical protein